MKAGEDSPDENQATLSTQPTLPAKASLIGLKLGGRYLIEKELGRGGMGAVYLARDKPELHSRPVVVKVLLEEALKNDWVVQKFQQEIESLTRLDDPGVIGIFDAGKLDDGTPYLVMQYVEGSNLRLRLKPEGMDLQAAANIIRQIGRSVTAAHDAGILHRDLKPENIMLRQTATGEQVKIIDFGIAKVTDSVSGVNTATGTAAGTVIYMSPEQLSARPLTPASDIYALGVIAYEMVTGRRPFNPESMFQLLEMHRGGVRVKPADLRPGLSAEAEAVILKALAFEPGDRYQRAQDFGDQLAGALIAESNTGGMTTSKIPKGENPVAPRNDQSSETVLAQPANPAATKPTPSTLETAYVFKKKASFAARMVPALVLVAAILGGLFLWKPWSQNANVPITSDPKPNVNAPPAEPVLTYSLTVQKVFGDKPMGEPEEYSGAEMFGNGWKFKFNVTPVADGYLYLLNAAPQPDGATEWNVLFPTPRNNFGQAKIVGGKKQAFGWYLFDNKPGQEKLWIVWSRQAIAELDTVVKEAAKTELVITEPKQIATVTDFLQKQETEKPVVNVDEKQRQSVVKSAQTTWAHLVQLRHDKY